MFKELSNNIKEFGLKGIFIVKFAPLKLTLIDRYLLSTFLKKLIGSMIIFILLVVFMKVLTELPDLIAKENENVTVDNIIKMYLSQIPYWVVLLSPIAFYLRQSIHLDNCITIMK